MTIWLTMRVPATDRARLYRERGECCIDLLIEWILILSSKFRKFPLKGHICFGEAIQWVPNVEGNRTYYRPESYYLDEFSLVYPMTNTFSTQTHFINLGPDLSLVTFQWFHISTVVEEGKYIKLNTYWNRKLIFINTPTCPNGRYWKLIYDVQTFSITNLNI